jgi:MFS family permease
VQGRNNIKFVLPILGVGIFLAFLDQSVIATTNGEIVSDLHAVKNVSWIATAYFLTRSASQPLYDKLSDVFGPKPCLLFAYAMFAIGSLGCGVAKSIDGLIVARDDVCSF